MTRVSSKSRAFNKAINDLYGIDLKLNRAVKDGVRGCTPGEHVQLLRELALHVVAEHECLSTGLELLHISNVLEEKLEAKPEVTKAGIR